MVLSSPADYQEEICVVLRPVSRRLARGLGKPPSAVSKNSRKSPPARTFPILIAMPAQCAGQEVVRRIMQHIENDDELRHSVAKRNSSPTTRSPSSTVNDQHLHHRCGLRQGKPPLCAHNRRAASGSTSRTSERRRLQSHHAAATPLPGNRVPRQLDAHGKRGTFWAMCTQYAGLPGNSIPHLRAPRWGSEGMNEEALRREARTEDNYTHEFLAEFGDLATGVFKAVYVDAAKKPYKYAGLLPASCCFYFMGSIEWPGHGHPGAGRRVQLQDSRAGCVDLMTIDKNCRRIDRCHPGPEPQMEVRVDLHRRRVRLRARRN